MSDLEIAFKSQNPAIPRSAITNNLLLNHKYSHYMTPAQKVLKKLGLKDQDSIEINTTNNVDLKENSRRSFFKKSAMGGIALGSAFMFSPVEELVAQSTQRVNRNSAPSDLKITD